MHVPHAHVVKYLTRSLSLDRTLSKDLSSVGDKILHAF
jgi:hypothetical protein